MEDKKLNQLLSEKSKGIKKTKEFISPNLITNSEKDPNSIVVDIRSKKPIVVFFGPRNIGKTVALIRLSKYLISKGVIIEPDKNFRKDDNSYQSLCDNFHAQFINNSIAPNSTAVVNFLLLKVKNSRGDICQLLEAPGEHYFNMVNQNSEYPPYLSTILSNDTPKIYVFFLEIGWGTKEEKSGYEARIADFIPRVKKTDHLIILCNKADKNHEFVYNGKPQIKQYREVIQEEYSKVFDKLGRKGFFSMFSPEIHPHDFLAFSAGSFIARADGSGQTYTIGDDYYPKELWNKIKTGLQGKWF